MAMKTVRVDTKITVQGFTKKLFKFKGKPNKTLERRAFDAFLRVNPTLKNKKSIEAGTILVVPEVSGAVVDEAVKAENTTSSLAPLLTVVAANLDELEAARKSADKFAKQELIEVTRLTKSKPVTKEISKSYPQHAARFAKMPQRVTERAAQQKRQSEQLAKALKEALSDIQKLDGAIK
jgi:hypothetical protein